VKRECIRVFAKDLQRFWKLSVEVAWNMHGALVEAGTELPWPSTNPGANIMFEFPSCAAANIPREQIGR
jgi:hypothetical protein